MANKQIGGIVILTADGLVLNAKGSWTWNLGQAMRESVIGADRIHGRKEIPQVGKLEGIISYTEDLTLKVLLNLIDATITMVLGNGHTFILRDAFFAGEGDGTTEDGEIAVIFNGEADIDEG